MTLFSFLRRLGRRLVPAALLLSFSAILPAKDAPDSFSSKTGWRTLPSAFLSTDSLRERQNRLKTHEEEVSPSILRTRYALAPETVPPVSSAEAFPERSPATPTTDGSFWHEDVWEQRDRGFLWYPTEEDEPRKVPDAFREAPRAPFQTLSEIPTLEELRRERVRRLEEAVMRPSPENMRRYLEVNTFVQEKSALFADQWQRTLWENPAFDYTVQHPAANFAQVALNSERAAARSERIAALGATHGLLYFYSGACNLCTLQNPLISELSRTTGLEVLAISVDGAPNPYFERALPDNGISRAIFGANPVTTPALFLVESETFAVQSLARGVVSLEDLKKRLDVLTRAPGTTLMGGIDASGFTSTSRTDPLTETFFVP